MRSAFARSGIWIALLICGSGCGRTPTPLLALNDKPALSPELATHYDPDSNGTISGRVVWSGPPPELHTFREAGIIPATNADGLDQTNPLRPRIDAKGHGLESAVVFLRKVDPRRSRPWDLPPVRIEMQPRSLIVEQNGPQFVGFTRIGDAVELVSRVPAVESLRARGAAFFTLAFPKPDQPLQRTISQSGWIEFSSAMGNYWERCWLFVSEHPYVVRTDAAGNFSLDQVPDGTYELVCWLPDWRIEHIEKDPETFSIARLSYRKPIEKIATVTVTKKQVITSHFNFGMSDFEKVE